MAGWVLLLFAWVLVLLPERVNLTFFYYLV